MTLINRLLNHPITLIRRVETGSDDGWGLPITTDERVDTVCYYQQRITGDMDRQTDITVYEDVAVWLPSDTQLGPYDAVEIDMGGRVEKMEVVGQPAAALNARSNRVNHLKLIVRRAAP